MPTAQNGSDGEHIAHLHVNNFGHTIDLADVVTWICKLVDKVTLGRNMAGLEP